MEGKEKGKTKGKGKRGYMDWKMVVVVIVDKSTYLVKCLGI